MAINELIALGGTQNKSPIQRFIETKQASEGMQQNRLAMQMRQQEFTAQQQGRAEENAFRKQQMAQAAEQFDINKQQTQRENASKLFSSIAPVLKTIEQSVDKQAAYESLKPYLAKQSQIWGVPFDMNDPYNSADSQAIINQYAPVKGQSKWAMLNGKEMNVVEDNGKLYDEVTDKQLVGAVPIVNKTATGSGEDWGLNNSGKNKVLQERITAQDTLYKQVNVIDKIIANVSDPNFIGGAAGNVVSTINSVAAQIRQVAGVDNILSKDGSLKADAVDPKSPSLSRYRKGAIITNANEAAIIELASALAKSNDPGGRVTENDYQFAKQMFTAGSDKIAIIDLLKTRREGSINQFNASEVLLEERFPDYKQSRYSEEKLGSLYGKKVGKISEASTEDLLKAFIKDGK